MMDYLITYLIEANASLLVLMLFYVLFLRTVSHFAWQRGFLLLAILVSAIIPLIDVEFMIPSEGSAPAQLIQGLSAFVPEGHLSFTEEPEATTVSSFNWTLVLSSLLLMACIGFLLKFAFQVFQLQRRLKDAQWHEELEVYISEAFEAAFSFANRIYIPAHYLDLPAEDLKLVIRHEQQHVRLNHHADNMILGLLRCIYWFSPGYWAAAFFLKATHEFQADEHTETVSEKTSYSTLLLKLNQQSPMVAFATPFSQNLIKMRVTKLNQPKSNAMKKGLFFMAAPLAGLLFYAFSVSPIASERNSETPLVNIQPNKLSLTLPVEVNAIKSYSGYGMRRDPFSKTEKLHKGIDLVAPLGTTILAAADGVVQKVEVSDEGYGNRIIIAHNDSVVTWYAHLQNMDVKEGEKVKAGKAIATCGNTGLSTGPHLHFEVRINEECVDPEQFIFIDTEAIKEAGLSVDRKKLVVILDPGHGGQDGGATNNDILEKNLSLMYANEIKALIEAKGIQVEMTRGGDYKTSLQERVDLTKNHQEALLISLHFNQSSETEAQGIETYYHAKDTRDGLLSKRFAQLFGTVLHNEALTNRGMRTSDFWILKNSECPTVLIELGFLTSRIDLARVSSETYRQRLCASIAESVELYAQ